jgi:dTDP-D-glucose 4,6-dehydratase
MTRASGYGFKPTVSIEQGIKETINWYVNHRDNLHNRYNAFTETAHLPKDTAIDA